MIKAPSTVNKTTWSFVQKSGSAQMQETSVAVLVSLDAAAAGTEPTPVVPMQTHVSLRGELKSNTGVLYLEHPVRTRSVLSAVVRTLLVSISQIPGGDPLSKGESLSFQRNRRASRMCGNLGACSRSRAFASAMAMVTGCPGRLHHALEGVMAMRSLTVRASERTLSVFGHLAV